MAEDWVRLCGEVGTGAPSLEPGRNKHASRQVTCFQKGKVHEVVLVLFFYHRLRFSKIPTESLDIQLAVSYIWIDHHKNFSKFLSKISG